MNPNDDLLIFFARCGAETKEHFIEQCKLLKGLLYEENRKYNLTRIRDDFEFWNRHIADSLSINLFFRETLTSAKRIADIGCGAGFPSLILALIFSDVKFTAIDSVGKKTNFVKMAAEKLELNNLTVITGRSNELKLSEKFDIITARAVADPVKIYKETKHLISRTGNYILYQTPSRIDELKTDIEKVSSHEGFQWKISKPFLLPGGENRIFLYSERK